MTAEKKQLSALTKKELGEVAKKETIKISQSWLKDDIVEAIIAGRREKKSITPEPAKTARRGEY